MDRKFKGKSCDLELRSQVIGSAHCLTERNNWVKLKLKDS